MASTVYDTFLESLPTGGFNPAVHTFYMLLVTSAYVPDAENHAHRGHVDSEVVGTGYVEKGKQVAVSVAGEVGAARITFGQVEWPGAVLTAAGAVVYRSLGGAADGDRLVCYADFGGNVVAAGDDLVVASFDILVEEG